MEADSQDLTDEEDLPALQSLALPTEWTVKMPSRPGVVFPGRLEQIGKVIDPNQHTASTVTPSTRPTPPTRTAPTPTSSKVPSRFGFDLHGRGRGGPPPSPLPNPPATGSGEQSSPPPTRSDSPRLMRSG